MSNCTSDCYYYKLHKRYKEKCQELSSENERLSSLIKNSCQILLEGARLATKCESDLSESLSETSPLTSPAGGYKSDNDFQPGANKWECLSEEEMLTYMQHNSTLFAAQQICSETTPIKEQNASDLTPEKVSLLAAPTIENLSRTALSKQHICKLPRCKDHQPAFVSSVKKTKMLSPDSRRLATNQRGKSPKGYWSLDMPSTQEIRNRNQD